MMDQLIQLDRSLFFLINAEWSHPLLDAILPLARNKYIWAPLYIFIGSFLLVNLKKDGVLMILYLVVLIFITDQLSSSVLKPAFERLRPCNDSLLRDQVSLLINCGSGFSFPSSHATNHFGVAQFLGLVLWRYNKSVLGLLWLWAAIVSYSQVYVGVHFPFDVIGGGVLGIALGTVLALLYKKMGLQTIEQ